MPELLKSPILLLVACALTFGAIACGDESESSQGSVSGPTGAGAAEGEPRAAIARLGRQASPAHTTAAIKVARSYLGARVAGDWSRTCALMSRSFKSTLQQTFGDNPRLDGEGCEAILAAVVGGLPEPVRRRQAEGVRFTELRAKGDRGHVLFESPAIPYGVMPMHLEDGDWKVAALAGMRL